MKDRLNASGSVLNYLSSVKTWGTSAAGNTAVFEAPEILIMKRGIVKNCSHAPSVAPSLSPLDFKAIIVYMHNMTPRPHVLITALLFGYFTLTRNVVHCIPTRWQHNHLGPLL